MNSSMKTFTFLIFIHLVSSFSHLNNVEYDQVQKVLKMFKPRNLLEIYSNGKLIEGENNSSCAREISLYLNRIHEEISTKVDFTWALQSKYVILLKKKNCDCVQFKKGNNLF